MQKHKDQLDCNVMPINVQNVAMQYYNLFFLKKAYINYDRETILNVCIMVAAKTQNLHELQLKYLVGNQIEMSRFMQALNQ